MPSAPASTPAIPRIAASHYRHDLDLSPVELETVISLASEVKRSPEAFARSLESRYIALLFEKPSLRTRITFELAIKQLGGDCVYQDHRDGRIGEREPAKDMARNLDRWVQAIVARVYSQKTIEELANWSAVPLINALSDIYHPCQALADFQTLKEHFGTLKGLKLAFIGDGNNVAQSLMLCASRLGVDFAIAHPPGYAPLPEIVEQAEKFAAQNHVSIRLTNDPEAAVKGASAVYTDAWTSMGWEAETQQRRIAFADYQVDEELMETAPPEAIFMHCLPAYRGEEVTEAVMESKRSVVFDQAENRLHSHKAILLMLMAGR